MIDNKIKSIEDMVKQINTSLTDKKQINEEINKFIYENNLVYNEKVNIEEMKHIFNENIHKTQKIKGDTGIVMDNFVYFHNQHIYSPVKEAHRLMKMFITYINDNLDFDKEDINILRLKLYVIFFPRVMNEEIKFNVSLLKVRNKEVEVFDKGINTGLIVMIIIGILLLLGGLTIPLIIV